MFMVEVIKKWRFGQVLLIPRRPFWVVVLSSLSIWSKMSYTIKVLTLPSFRPFLIHSPTRKPTDCIIAAGWLELWGWLHSELLTLKFTFKFPQISPIFLKFPFKISISSQPGYWCPIPNLIQFNVWILPKNDSFNIQFNIALPKIQFKILFNS